MLSCDAIGQPRPDLTWIKDGHSLRVDGGRVVRRGDDVIIRGVASADRGRYECEAYNGIGQPQRKIIDVEIVGRSELSLGILKYAHLILV